MASNPNPSTDGAQPLATPRQPLAVVGTDAGEELRLGPIKCRIVEDGTQTDNRLSTIIFTLPPHTPGPPGHWHEMHDETFFVLRGTLQFHTLAPGVAPQPITAPAGTFVSVPTRSPHTFANPFGDEAEVLVTFTPAFYVDYFRLMARLGTEMTRERNLELMARFATIEAPEMRAM